MRISLALFAVALAAVACGDSTDSSSADLCAGSGAAATVTADNYAFTPDTVTITAGQSVCWQNTDTQMHTVIPGNTFSGSLLPGQTFVYTFLQSNVSWPYHCNQHSTMTGTIVVNP